MPELSTISVFMLASVVLLIIPGPAVFYIISRSIDQGRIAGIISVLGIGVGTIAHIAAAALGVSMLLVSSPLAFNIVKYAGAAYLVYLGIQSLLENKGPQNILKMKQQSLGRIFYQAVIVNVLNPKTALFFLAFLPQFLDVSRGEVAVQIVIFGFIFIVLGIFIDGLWAIIAGTVGERLKLNMRYSGARRYFGGSTLIALGVGSALSTW